MRTFKPCQKTLRSTTLPTQTHTISFLSQKTTIVNTIYYWTFY